MILCVFHKGKHKKQGVQDENPNKNALTRPVKVRITRYRLENGLLQQDFAILHLQFPIGHFSQFGVVCYNYEGLI